MIDFYVNSVETTIGQRVSVYAKEKEEGKNFKCYLERFDFRHLDFGS